MTSTNISILASPAHRLAALVFTDIVGSTQLKSRLRAGYLPLLSRHNELFEMGIAEVPGAEIIKHTGDGFFASFPTASDAVRFALVFQARMRLEPWPSEKIETRLGIHIGEVVFMDMAGRKDIVGLSADIAARLMSLAIGGQILLTETAFNDARQYVSRTPEIIDDAQSLRWIAHGRYLFKGADDPLEVYEVGTEKFSPLQRPVDSEKVKRIVPHDQESTLGWRPAAALPVPGRPGWKLVRHLGDGGFGEVWLGEREKLKDSRVFKFCFDVERVRSLKREYMLFRLLREALGNRSDIAALYEVKLDEPPFFLESEYSAGGNLMEWTQQHGGIGAIPLPDRLEFLAKVADAVAAAHSVGVLHKDIKPSNILVRQSADGRLCPLLADFGIGVLSDRSRLKAHNVTEVGGLTEVGSASNSQSFGTRMYAPPESMGDKPYTTKGDIYALGVMLYQFVVGDLLRPLAPGWERDVHDELLREDITAAAEGDVDRRIATAEEFAHRLRTLDARRAEITSARAATKAREQRVRRRRQMAIGSGALIGVLALATVFFTVRSHELGLKNAEINAANDKAVAANEFLLDVIRQADPANAKTGTLTAEQLVLSASRDLDTEFTEDSDINAELQMAFADALRNFDDREAVDHYKKAAQIYAKLHGPEDPNTLLARSGEYWAMLLREQTNQVAKDLLRDLKDVLDKQGHVLGPENRDTLQTFLLYAAAMNNVEGLIKAAPLYDEVLKLRQKNFTDDNKDTIQSISACSSTRRDLGRLDEAEKLAKQAYDWRCNKFGKTNLTTLPSLQLYGSILVDLGRATEAEPMLKILVDESIKDFGEVKPKTLKAYAAYADALTATKKYDDAETYYKKAIDDAKPMPGGDFKIDTLVAQSGYAELLIATGRADQAEKLAGQAVTGLAKKRPGRRETLRAIYVYACALEKLGKLEDAKTQYQLAADGAKKLFVPDSPITKRYADDYEQFCAKLAKATIPPSH